VRRFIAVLVLLVAVTASLTAYAASRSRPALVGPGADLLDLCRTPTSASDWVQLHHRSTVFGLDMLVVRTSARLTLISATPIHDGGGLRVTHVALVPAGNYGSAESWGDGSGDRYSAAEWRDRREFPGGVLHQFKDPAALGYDPTSEPSAYQLVIGVQPSNEAGGRADGMLIIYQVDGMIHAIQSSFRFGITKSGKDCLGPKGR
jgi:hypothetical protein